MSIVKGNKKRYIIHLGDYNANARDRGEQRFFVKEKIIHPEYNGSKKSSADLAILKLDKSPSEPYKPKIKPFHLPPMTTVSSPGDRCQIFGWGETLKPTNYGWEQYLHSNEVNITSRDRCNEDLGAQLHKNMICAGKSKNNLTYMSQTVRIRTL